MTEDLFQTGFTQQQATLASTAQTVGTQFDLPLALFAAHIEHPFAGEMHNGLEQQRGFSYAGLTAQQD